MADTVFSLHICSPTFIRTPLIQVLGCIVLILTSETWWHFLSYSLRLELTPAHLKICKFQAVLFSSDCPYLSIQYLQPDNVGPQYQLITLLCNECRSDRKCYFICLLCETLFLNLTVHSQNNLDILFLKQCKIIESLK